jgi:hypothetical protein
LAFAVTGPNHIQSGPLWWFSIRIVLIPHLGGQHHRCGLVQDNGFGVTGAARESHVSQMAGGDNIFGVCYSGDLADQGCREGAPASG